MHYARGRLRGWRDAWLMAAPTAHDPFLYRANSAGLEGPDCGCEEVSSAPGGRDTSVRTSEKPRWTVGARARSQIGGRNAEMGCTQDVSAMCSARALCGARTVDGSQECRDSSCRCSNLKVDQLAAGLFMRTVARPLHPHARAEAAHCST